MPKSHQYDRSPSKPLISTTEAPGWTLVAPVYSHVERVTVPASETLVSRVSSLLPLSLPNATAFDNGCGPGVLSSVLKKQYPYLPVLATDISDGMISLLRQRIARQQWASVTARVVDSRELDGVKDGTFYHTFSTFMVCLASEPDKIVSEMWRVTRESGVLGLAVWGDPYFGPYSKPWTAACRRQIPDYESPMLMGASWTLASNVKAGLETAGFTDVDVRVEDLYWRWDSLEAVSKYFFDGGNPANLKLINHFKARGGDVDEVKPHFDRILQDVHGLEDGEIVLHVVASLATARKGRGANFIG